MASTIQTPYILMTEAELLSKIEHSRKRADEGKSRNADDVLSDMRSKYGL